MALTQRMEAVHLVLRVVLLVSLPVTRCQERSVLEWLTAEEGHSHRPWTAEEVEAALETLREIIPLTSPSGASSPSAGSSDWSSPAVEDREYSYGEYEAALQAALAAWASSELSDQELPSAVRTPNDWPPSRGLLEQLLQRPGSSGSQPDVTSLLGALLSNQAGGGGGGGSALAALLQKTSTTTTTARPTRIFDRFVIRDGNPFATMRPKTTPGSTAAVTQKTTAKPQATTPADAEVDKFDTGFQIFSQMFGGGGGGNGLTALNADAFSDTQTTPAPPITVTTTTAPPATAATQQLSWPFYTKPTRGTTSRPLPDNYNFNNNYVDKVDFSPVRPTNVPFYFNIHQTAAPPTREPQINLRVLLGSVTQLVKSDGPSMIAAMYDAATYIREGNVMGLLQGVVPVFSRATPVFMNMIQAVAPAIEKSDFYSGAEVSSGPYRPSGGGGGLGGLFNSFTGFLTGRRRPSRPFRRPFNKQSSGGAASAFRRPYYLGQVMGSGLKLVTYLINHGTTVVRARHPDTSGDGDGDSSWLKDAVGADNAQYLREWLGERQARAYTGRS